MINRIRRILARDPESGSGTFIFNFMLFPVMLGFFGLAFDFSAAFWAKGSLQQYLDAATQSALGQVSNPTNGVAPSLSGTPQQAANAIALRAEAQYATNRFGTPFLACQSGGTDNPSVPSGYIPVQPSNGCAYSLQTLPALSIARNSQLYTFKMNVHEETRFMFLKLVGFSYQGYNLSSTASLSTSYVAPSN